jgi:hypothetical protein
MISLCFIKIKTVLFVLGRYYNEYTSGCQVESYFFHNRITETFKQKAKVRVLNLMAEFKCCDIATGW